MKNDFFVTVNEHFYSTFLNVFSNQFITNAFLDVFFILFLLSMVEFAVN